MRGKGDTTALRVGRSAGDGAIRKRREAVAVVVVTIWDGILLPGEAGVRSSAGGRPPSFCLPPRRALIL